MRPYVVEFVGSRGVGKTTLAKAVELEFCRRQVSLNRLDSLSMRDRAQLHAAGMLRYFRSSYAFLRWRPESFRYWRKLQHRFRTYIFRSGRFSRGSGIYLMEEGLFQLVLTAYLRTSRKDFESIFRILKRYTPLPDMVVFVKAPYGAILERRRRRGNAGDVLRSDFSARDCASMDDLDRFMAQIAGSAQLPVLLAENYDFDSLQSNASAIADYVLNAGPPGTARPRVGLTVPGRTQQLELFTGSTGE